MPDDQNLPKNSIPEENSIPASPQEPMADAPILPMDSEPAEVPPEAPEADGNGFSDESNNIPLSNSDPLEGSGKEETIEKSEENQVTQAEEIPIESTKTAEPEPVLEELKAQISTNEPLPVSTESSSEAKSETGEAEAELEANLPKTETKTSQSPNHTEAKPPYIAPVVPKVIGKNMQELQVKEQKAIKEKLRKRLENVLNLFTKQKSITNDEVEKFLHVSDATATRYLSQLEKEGKIKQNGKTGKGVFYSKII